MKERRQFPTLAELRAIEREAQRAQAEELRRLIVAGARRLAALLARGAAALARKARRARTPVRHGV